MGRPRAGHGWTWDDNGRHLIGNSHGDWVFSYVAKEWPRCSRCRRPDDAVHTAEVGPFAGQSVCNTCFYYHCIPPETFWSRKGEYLFPYNIGRRMTLKDWQRLDPDDYAQWLLKNPGKGWESVDHA